MNKKYTNKLGDKGMKIVRIVTHHDKPERAAELFAQEGVVAVGWADVGDISGKSREEIKTFLMEEWGQTEQEAAIGAAQLLRFRDEIDVGDLVFAYKGRNKIALVGEVRGGYEYNDKNRVGDPEGDIGYPNQRKVNWWDSPRNFDRRYLPPDLEQKVALPGTIHIFERNEEYINILKQGLRKLPTEEIRRTILEVENEDEIKNYILSNPSDLEEGLSELKPEHQTSVGNVDFLGKDKNGISVVIEVKVNASDSVIGQLLGYMQAYKEESRDENLRGIIVAENFTERCKRAAKASGLRLYKCEKRLVFSEIE
jgi:predicted Mrr-cat superfamily restriction endonuclease